MLKNYEMWIANLRANPLEALDHPGSFHPIQLSPTPTYQSPILESSNVERISHVLDFGAKMKETSVGVV
jgi:hypothetical protein